MTKLSFIIPVHNGEKYIEKTIQSLFKQTYKNIEIVAVNDYSNDDSLNMLKSLMRKDNRLKVSNNKGEPGEGATRNWGNRLVTGEIILPTDIDDPNSPNRAEISLRELTKNKADIFYSNLQRYYQDTGKSELRHFQPYDKQLLRYINYIAHAGSSAYYKYVINKVGGYDNYFKVGTDYDLWLSAQENDFSFCYKNIPLATYTMHANQVTNSNDPEIIKKRQFWNREVRQKHKIYSVDLEYVKKTALPEVQDFYVNKNYDLWFAPETIPIKS